jgi:hypothetical protein
VFDLKPEEDEIAPGNRSGVQAFHQNPDRAACEARKAKLCVIEVWFEDGKVWRARVGAYEK